MVSGQHGLTSNRYMRNIFIGSVRVGRSENEKSKKNPDIESRMEKRRQTKIKVKGYREREKKKKRTQTKRNEKLPVIPCIIIHLLSFVCLLIGTAFLKH